MKQVESKTKKCNGKNGQKSSSESHLDDTSWIKNRIRFNMQLVEDFQQVKEDRDLDKREKAYYNELEGGDMVLPEELWDKIHRITERADLPSYKVTLHEIVKSAKKHCEEKYGVEVDVR